jgi:sodium/bile acid cotransporter 7
MRIKIDWFLAGMIAAVGLAWALPSLGAKSGPLHPDFVNRLGVALIFFLNGVSLSFASMKAGALRWPLHLVVQLSTFLLFPLVGLGLLALCGNLLVPALGLGFFFLCALPSTVSSSVAMTSAAKGNVPAAVFNATLSSLIGVFITPLWIGWIGQSQGGQAMPLLKVITDLLLWLILPLVLGQLSRPWLADWAKRRRPWLFAVDRVTILFIIYTSFCDSILRGVWSEQGPGTLISALIGGGVIFFIMFGLIWAICRLLDFPLPDRITAVFCGSKKTLVSGVPMAQIIFGADPRLGIILLPLMIYHSMQLVICAVLAGRWGRRSADAN